MTQNINFLKTIPTKKNYLPANWIALIVLMILIVLAFMSMMLITRQIYLSHQLHEAQKQFGLELSAFQKIAQIYPMFATDTPLVTQVSQYEHQLEVKQAKFDKVTHTTLRKPFSTYLKALSESVPEGLWLTTFNINEDVQDFSIHGYSLTPLLVSNLIEKLQNHIAFSGVIFDLFFLKKMEDGAYLEFEIANEQLEGSEPKPPPPVKKKT